MRNDKNVPKIRFDEFNEEWSKGQLRKLVDIFDGTHQTPKYTKNGVKFVSVENIKSLETDKYISIDDFIKEYSSKRPQKGDVLMTRIGDIGTTNIVKSDEALGYYVTLALLKPKKIDGIYLSYSINSKSVQKDLWRRTLHIAFPKKINLGEIEKIEIKFPELEEQIMIGNYFENLDNLISSQKHKYEKLLDLKKAMLYKLFPKEGEVTPEIRFNGFTEDWKKTSISELLEERNTQLPKDEEYPLKAFIAYEGIADKGDRYDRSSLVKDEDNKKYKRTELGDFIYSSNNLTTGSIGLNKFGKSSISPVYSIFSAKKKVDYNFIGVVLTRKEFINKMIKTRQGVVYGQWRIHEKDFLDLFISAPNYNEQKVIGEYFSRLDNLINLNKEKLDKLKNVKSSLLDNMFV